MLADSDSSRPCLSNTAPEQSSISLTMTAVADRIIRVEICSATATNPLRTISSVMGSTDMSGSCLQSRLTIAFMKWS